MVSKILVLGCGNIMRGDDGFGPKVIEYLESNYNVSSHVELIDAGLGCGNILLDIVFGDKKPKKIIIIDASNLGKEPGELIEFDIKSLSSKNIISSHQFPDPLIIRELMKIGITLHFVSCQLGFVPNELTMGLSKSVSKAIPNAAAIIANYTGLKRRTK